MTLKRPARATRFTEISTSIVILNALDAAESSGHPSRVLGRSGFGKSTAMAELLAEGRAIGCEVPGTDTDIGTLHRLLLELYELPNYSSHTRRELREAVYDGLPGRDQARPLILDECQWLQPKALRELLAVQEAKGFALLLLGNGETIVQRKKVDEERAMEQIRNRFDFQEELDELLDADFLNIADEWSVEDEPNTRAAIVQYGRLFSLHQLVMLLKGARQLSGIGAVRMEHLRAVVELKNRSRLSLFQPRKSRKG